MSYLFFKEVSKFQINISVLIQEQQGLRYNVFWKINYIDVHLYCIPRVISIAAGRLNDF